MRACIPEQQHNTAAAASERRSLAAQPHRAQVVNDAEQLALRQVAEVLARDVGQPGVLGELAGAHSGLVAEVDLPARSERVDGWPLPQHQDVLPALRSHQ